jgi:uncharacterized RDD family membrane protein YckC
MSGQVARREGSAITTNAAGAGADVYTEQRARPDPRRMKGRFCTACGASLEAQAVCPRCGSKQATVVLPNVYGGRWRRLAAYLLDVLIFAPCVLAVQLSVGQRVTLQWIDSKGYAHEFPYWEVGFLGTLLIVLAYTLYFAVLESSSWEASFGKRMLGLRVVDERGSRLSFLQASARALGKFFTAFLLLGFLWVLFDERRQGLHDKMAHSVVVKRAASYPVSDPAPVPEDLLWSYVALAAGAALVFATINWLAVRPLHPSIQAQPATTSAPAPQVDWSAISNGAPDPHNGAMICYQGDRLTLTPQRGPYGTEATVSVRTSGHWKGYYLTQSGVVTDWSTSGYLNTAKLHFSVDNSYSTDVPITLKRYADGGFCEAGSALFHVTP